MEELLYQMQNAREVTIVGYAEFLREFNPTSDDIYCFVEAREDEIYYDNVIRVLTGLDPKTYRCNDKDGVLHVYGLIMAQPVHKKAKKAFFVDRDFDAQLVNEDIYETPVHSIENLYATRDIFSRVLHSEFNIRRNEIDHEVSLGLFKNLQDQYHDALLPLNAYLKCHATARKAGFNGILNLKAIDFTASIKPDLSKLEIDNLDLPLTFQKLENFFGKNVGISERDFDEALNSLSQTNPEHSFRGKFQLDFFSCFLIRFKKLVNPKKGHLLSQKYNSKASFNRHAILVELRPYADTPECLRKYITLIAA